MDDNRIELVARVDVDESANQIIQHDLDKLQGKINAVGGLKIDCSIDTKNFDVLRKQISEFSKGLKIDIGGVDINAPSNIDINTNNIDNIKQSLIETNAEISKTISAVNTVFSVDSEAIGNLKAQLNELRIGESYIDGIAKRMEKLDVVVEKITPKFTTFGDSQNLTSLNISGTDAFGNSVEYIERFDKKSGEFIEATTKIVESLKQVGSEEEKVKKQTESLEKAYNEFLKLSGRADLLEKSYGSNEKNGIAQQIRDIQEAIQQFDNTQPLAEQQQDIIKISNAIKLVVADIQDISFDKAIVSADNLQRKLVNLQSKFTDENSAKPIRNEESIQLLDEAYQSAIKAVNDLREANKDTFLEADNLAKSAVDNYNNLAVQLRNAETAATKLRAKPISVIKDEQIQALNTFIEKVQGSGVKAIDDLVGKAEQLKKELNNVSDTKGVNDVLNQFTLLKAEFKTATAEKQKLDRAFKTASADQTFENRLKKITAQVQSFEQANNKATTSLKQMSDGRTFAQGWEDLKKALNSADLNADGLKHINEQLATFKAEANSAGLTSSAFFKNMGEQIKGVVTQYVSLTFAISKIGNAINELKSIDDILTEISKTSDRTTESLQRLGETSFDRANQFGRKASDYLYGVQEMSRAGFGEMQSENLAELSILAQSAGDLTTELANDYIIATNAAYKFNGNVEKLNATLDSQNYITNNNALSMEDLASATRLAASQAANAGIGIDELTAATGTMIATTRESGDVAARAFRGIIMNLQQTKATAEEIGDGGLDITTESLTKYEKAVADLGVSIKEVKNGVTQLRNPMEILRDLSIAVSKESEGSIKVANLISSVGGKYRGNQLIALLENWSTYEKMLSEFNSEGAIGSSMSEATKSANNWSGSLNQLSNSWTEFISKIVNSEDAIQTINTINSLIQNATDSGFAESLSNTVKLVVDVTSAIGKLANTVGALPVLFGTGATVKGLGIFGTIADKSKEAGIALTGFGTKINSTGDLLTAFTAKTNWAAVGTKTLSVALNTLTNIGIAWGINLAITGITKLINLSKEAKERAEELRTSASESAKKIQLESQGIDDLSKRYTELITSTSDVKSIKDDLIALQDEINAGYDDEASKVDLLNGKYSENLKLLSERKEILAQDYIDENRLAIEQAQENLNTEQYQIINRGFYRSPLTLYGTSEERLKQLKEFRTFYGELENKNDKIYTIINNETIELEKQVTADKEILKTAEEYQKVLDDSNSITTETQAGYDELVDKIVVAKQHLSDLLNSPDSNDNDIIKARDGLKELMSEMTLNFGMLPKFKNEIEMLYESANERINESIKSAQEYKNDFNDLLKSTQDAKKGITDIEKAMQSLANGERISSEDAWHIMSDLDVDGILSQIKMVNGEFEFSIDELIKLKDSYVNKINEDLSFDIQKLEDVPKNLEQKLKRAKLRFTELQKLGVNSLGDAKIINEARAEVQAYENSLKEVNKVLAKENLLRQEINAHLGNTINLAEAAVKATEKEIKNVDSQIKGLKAQLDEENRKLKEQLKPIEDNIKALEKQKDVISESKEELQEQLEILEEQADNLNKTLDNYKNVASLVKDEIEKENDLIKEQQDAIKNQYDEQIQALKDVREQKEEENALTEKEIKMQEKLKALEDARNQKVKTYSSERGWYFDVDREAVVKAENEYADARKDYEDLKEKQDFDAQIKALEDERDNLIKQYDIQIEAGQKYLKQWEEILDAEEKADAERLAGQILGAEWREKILSKDTELIVEFGTEYSNYSKKLKQLTEVEIANLKKSIKAKDDEVKAIEKQIKAQKDLKTSYEDAAKALTDGLQAQIDNLNNKKSGLESALAEQKAVVEAYTGQASALVNGLADAWSALDTATYNSLKNSDTNLRNYYGDYVGAVDEMANAWYRLRDAMIAYAETEALDKLDKANGGSSAIANMLRNVWGFSTGGTADFTGLAMLHGSQSQAETIFNASQSKALYNMVASGQFSDMVANKAVSGINSALSKTSTNNNSSMVINIDKVVTDNPQNFTQQLDKYMSDYWTKKLTMSYTR